MSVMRAKKIILKVCASFAVAGFLLCATLIALSAHEAKMPELPDDGWQKFAQAIPEEVEGSLEGDFFGNEDEFAQAVARMSSGEYLASVMFDVLGVEFKSTLAFFFSLCALVIVAAVFGAVGVGSENSSLASSLRFCSVGAVISYLIFVQVRHFELLDEFFSKLGGLFAGMIPVSATIWAMGGNVSTASVGVASFSVILGVSEAIFSYTLIPVCCILTVLGFCDSIGGEIKLGKVLSAIKKIYNFLLVFVMTVLLASLAAQTSLAASADTAAAKAARLVSGSVIPILGGSVGETFRTVAAGISYMKNVFGIGGIIMIAITVLPTLASLLLTRFALLLCAGLADMLGASSEAKLLDGVGEVYGTMLAVCAGAAALFIIALYIFMRSVVAIA